MVETNFGGSTGHNLDLIALDSNVQWSHQRSPLRHFMPYPAPGSARVNVFNQDLTCDGVIINAYVFPPLLMILLLLCFLLSQRAVSTMVVPCLSPLPSWWPIIRAMKVICDLRNEFPIKAIGVKKPKKNQGFNGMHWIPLKP